MQGDLLPIIYFASTDFRDVCLKSSSTESERCLSVDNADKA